MILMCLTDGNVFTILQKVIEVKAKASYNDLTRALEERFCGDDYKRTLETKLQGLQYRKNVNINNFIHELRNTIQELYGIKNESAVESLAVNHVISNLELALRNVHMLQLANPNTKLESILELLETRVGGNPLHISATAWNLPIKEDRMDRLEKMVTNLTASVSELTSEVGNQRKILCVNIVRKLDTNKRIVFS